MQKGKVAIADGKPETRDKLNKFKSEYNIEHPSERLRTLGDTIDKLIEEVTITIPALRSELEIKEKWVKGLEEHKKELISCLKACEQTIEEKDMRIDELEEENKKLKGV